MIFTKPSLALILANLLHLASGAMKTSELDLASNLNNNDISLVYRYQELINASAFIDNACPILPRVDNGFVILSRRLAKLAKVQCNCGFQLSGRGEIACLDDGTWTQPGTCSPGESFSARANPATH